VSENGDVRQTDAECLRSFQERNRAEQMKYWAEREPKLRKDYKRERKGFYYLALSIVSILGGFAGLIYGLAGKDWVQKPYVIMALVMIALGLSIVIGGFGRVKT